LAGANPESQPGVYRPIRSLLYLVYYQFFGTNPFFYYLHSLIVHLTATVLVFFIIRAIGGIGGIREIGGFAGAILFGLHPVHTESITYIAASMEMTGVAFFLAAFLLYVRSQHSVSRRGLAMPACVVFAILAFFTYEMTLTLPILLVVYEWVLGEMGKTGRIGRRIRAIGIIGAIGILYLVVRFSLGVGLGRGDYLAYSFYHTQLTMLKMWVHYILLLIWPVTLSHNHTVVPGFEAFMTPYSDQAAILSQTILDPEILFSIGVIGGIGVIGWKMRTTHPILSFSIFWFFIALLPVSYIVPQGTAIAEKYLYLASFGFVLVLAFLFRLPRIPRSLRVLIVVLLVVFYGARTIARNADWRSPRTLWEYEARVHPESELAYYNLGIIYGQSGEKEKAAAAYTKALELKPQFWQARHNLRNVLQIVNPTNTTNNPIQPINK